MVTCEYQIEHISNVANTVPQVCSHMTRVDDT